jgi:hypothetical protein
MNHHRIYLLHSSHLPQLHPASPLPAVQAMDTTPTRLKRLSLVAHRQSVFGTDAARAARGASPGPGPDTPGSASTSTSASASASGSASNSTASTPTGTPRGTPTAASLPLSPLSPLSPRARRPRPSSICYSPSHRTSSSSETVPLALALGGSSSAAGSSYGDTGPKGPLTLTEQ